MSWDGNSKNCTINHVYGIIEFIGKNNKRFDAILKLDIEN